MATEQRMMPVVQVLALADQHRRAGNLAAAESLCRQVLEARPQHAEALHLLGIVAHQGGNSSAAIDLIRQAIAVDDAAVLYHSNLCEMCRQAGRLDEAIAAGKRAIELSPKHAAALNNLGIAYFDIEDYPTAERYYRRALAADPNFAEAHSNLGNALRAQNKLEEAILSYNRAIKLRPGYSDAIANLASVLHMVGQLDEAIAAYRWALTLDPVQSNAHSGLGILYLLKGKFEAGWAEYEWRLRTSEHRHRPPPGPVWDGGDPAGRRILIYGEQGFGDAIHFCRYLAMLRDRGATVLLRIMPSVAEVIADGMPGIEVSSAGPLPLYDCHCPILSLPHRFGTNLDNVPRSVPYLHARDDAIARWAARLDAGATEKELKVGLVWTGNPKHINNANRSVPIAALLPILAVEGVRFVSLQVGARANELTVLSKGTVPDLAPALTDYSETAGAVSNLDLVITVDTSVAHIAGALGRPVWVMMSWVPDWRWMLGREDSPWYPTMRLFRQRSKGDWGVVVEAIAAELRAVVGGDATRLTPYRDAPAQR